MAVQQGWSEIRFDLSKMPKGQRKEFEGFLEDWRQQHDQEGPEMNWLFFLEKSSQPGWDYGAEDDQGDSETMDGTHRLLREAAEKFPKLRAKGSGCWNLLMDEGGGADYSFTLADGQLNWSEEFVGEGYLDY